MFNFQRGELNKTKTITYELNKSLRGKIIKNFQTEITLRDLERKRMIWRRERRL